MLGEKLPDSYFESYGTCLITGGLGSLGVCLARWLADHGVKNLALLGRSGKPQSDVAGDLEALSSSSSPCIVIRACDVSCEEAVRNCFEELGRTLPITSGVFHAAGVLDDHAVRSLSSEHLKPVLGPKIDGTLHLHAASAALDVQTFCMFSSVASMLGNPGQANYCAANAFMDSFAQYRLANGRPALSIQWGPWAEVGMAARAGFSGVRFPLLDPKLALEAFGATLQSAAGKVPQGVAARGVIGLARVNWAVVLGRVSAAPPLLECFRPTSLQSAAPSASISTCPASKATAAVSNDGAARSGDEDTGAAAAQDDSPDVSSSGVQSA